MLDLSFYFQTFFRDNDGVPDETIYWAQYTENGYEVKVDKNAKESVYIPYNRVVELLNDGEWIVCHEKDWP